MGGTLHCLADVWSGRATPSWLLELPGLLQEVGWTMQHGAPYVFILSAATSNEGQQKNTFSLHVHAV